MDCETTIELEQKVIELEKQHQADCITINQLNVALDVMTEKYYRLRQVSGLCCTK